MQNTNKPKLCVGARQWLEWYADTAGDHSPMHLETFLPKGRKSCYYAMYVYVRGDRDIVSLQTFLEAWRHELPMIKIASSLCKLQHCGVCDYLNYQIDCCPQSIYEYLAALIRRLGQHYNMQSAQRLAQDRLEEQCNQSDGRAMFMKIDKMESRAVNVPCKWSLSSMSFP